MIITKQELGKLIENRPSGVEPNEIIDGLVKRGHQIEGVSYGFTKQERLQKAVGYGQETSELAREGIKATSIGGLAKETLKTGAKTLLQPAAKFVVSAAEVPYSFATNKATGIKYPGIGKSYISEAEERAGKIIEGEKPLYTAAAPFAEVPLAGLETAGYLKLGQKLLGSTTKKALKAILPETAQQAGKKEATKILSKAGKEGGAKTTGLISKKVVVQPTANDIDIAETIKGSVGKNPVKTIERLNNRIAETGEDVADLLSANKAEVNPVQVMKYIDDSVQPSELVKVADTNKVFSKVKDFISNTLEKTDVKDNLSLWKARQKIDDLFKKEFGEALYNPESPVHLPVKDAYYKMRRAINEFIGSTVPEGEFASSMRELSNLYDAIDMISTKNYKILGTTTFKKFTQKHPLITKAVGYGTAGYLIHKGSEIIGGEK